MRVSEPLDEEELTVQPFEGGVAVPVDDLRGVRAKEPGGEGGFHIPDPHQRIEGVEEWRPGGGDIAWVNRGTVRFVLLDWHVARHRVAPAIRSEWAVVVVVRVLDAGW